MNVVASYNQSIIKNFPSISDEMRKISAALEIEEAGSHLKMGFLPYAFACHRLIEKSAQLRKTHTDLDAALQALSGRVQAAYAKLAPSDLLRAVKKNDLKTAMQILEMNPKARLCLSNGELPLHYAIRCGSADIVNYLLQSAGADPLAKDHQGLTAFDHASLSKDLKMTALVMGAALGTTIPESAILSEKAQQAEVQGLALDIRKFRYPPLAALLPLHSAAFLGDINQLEELSKKADLFVPDVYGMTALSYAVVGGKAAAVEWLLAKKGAKLEADSNGISLLHLAAIGGSEAVIRLLLDTKKFDPNMADKSGRVPLHFAIAAEQFSAARALVKRGADPLVRTTLVTTPFAILNTVSEYRAAVRDPLKLNVDSVATFGLFAASAVCSYLNVFPSAAKVLGALPLFHSIWHLPHFGHPILRIGTGFLFSHSLHAHWMDYRVEKSCYRGLHTAMLGKSFFDTFRASWKNSAIETYRPLRNILIYGANALFSAWQFVETSGIKKQLVCEWGNEADCILELQPEYIQPKECRGLETGATEDDLEVLCDPARREARIQSCMALNEKGVNCERLVPVEDSATCKARVKPHLDELLKYCRQGSETSLQDAETIMKIGGFGQTNLEKAKENLFAKFTDEAIRQKVEKAYQTVKFPPPLYYNPFDVDCTGLSQETCILKAGGKLYHVSCPDDESNNCLYDKGRDISRKIALPGARSVLGLGSTYTERECKKAAKALKGKFQPDRRPDKNGEFAMIVGLAQDIACAKVATTS